MQIITHRKFVILTYVMRVNRMIREYQFCDCCPVIDEAFAEISRQEWTYIS